MIQPSHSRLLSTVQVEITFENPVVFAGQTLNAIITFKNPNEPAPVPLGTSTHSHHNLNESQTTPYHDNNAHEFSSAGKQSSLPIEDNKLSPVSGMANRTRPARAMSARQTSPFLTAAIPDDSSNLSPPLDSTIPSPIASNSNLPSLVTHSENSSSITNLPDSSSLTIAEDTSSVSEGGSSPISPESATNGFGGWEISGRRLSSQLANSFRELYWSNSSTPEISPSIPKRPPSHSPLVPLNEQYTSDDVSNSQDNSLYQNGPAISRWGSGGNRLIKHQLTRSGSTYVQPQRSQNTQGLLMGYAQLQGYFVVDDELIDAQKFSHVKTQGVVVRPSGGIGYSSQNGTGLLQGLASGLGSLLQIRDSDTNSSSEGLYRNITFGRSGSGLGRSNSRRLGSSADAKNDAIPIFSTPQSLLFVDLKVGPGESRSYRYQIQLPKSLPPSCRTKSIRIHYNLVVGIQKLDSRGRPQPKTTFVSFRVFPHVDKYGQQYTHDLQMPIVLQKDVATVVQLPSERYMSLEKALSYTPSKTSKSLTDSPLTEDDKPSFESYLEGLLLGDEDTKNKLLSQQDPSAKPRRLSTPQDNIEFFSRYQQSLNAQRVLKSRFDIGRSGKRIATLILSKPVYRVGDDIVFVVDYSSAALKCFHITASLETEEAISSDVLKQFKDQQLENPHAPLPSIDTSSMTRRVYSQSTMSTYSLSRSTFEFTIPATATPQFSTSAIALKWILKLDFITSPALPDEDEISASQPKKVAEDLETVTAVAPQALQPSQLENASRRAQNNNNSTNPSEDQEGDTHRRNRQSNHSRHRSQSSFSRLEVEFPYDSRSPLQVLHFNDQALIAGTKETLACESFNCKIPLTVMPTNQDIGALLEHSVSATRILNM